MANIEEKIEKLTLKTINDLGYELYDIEYVKEGKDYFLRIYIDSKNGIDLDDCELVSNSITELLDREDYIKEQYFLEVSSPGIERTLRKEKHFLSQIGNEIRIKLFKPIDKQKELIGILTEYNKEEITIKVDEKTIKINSKDIANAKTIFNW